MLPPTEFTSEKPFPKPTDQSKDFYLVSKTLLWYIPRSYSINNLLILFETNTTHNSFCAPVGITSVALFPRIRKYDCQ